MCTCSSACSSCSRSIWFRFFSIPRAIVVMGVSVGLFSNGSCKWMAIFSIKRKEAEMATTRGTSKKPKYSITPKGSRLMKGEYDKQIALYAGCWYSPMILPAGSAKRVVISGASNPTGCTMRPPLASMASIVL